MTEMWYESDKYVPEDGAFVLVCDVDGKIETGYYSETDHYRPCFITPSCFMEADAGVYWCFIPTSPYAKTQQSRIVKCKIPIIYRREEDIYVDRNKTRSE